MNWFKFDQASLKIKLTLTRFHVYLYRILLHFFRLNIGCNLIYNESFQDGQFRRTGKSSLDYLIKHKDGPNVNLNDGNEQGKLWACKRIIDKFLPMASVTCSSGKATANCSTMSEFRRVKAFLEKERNWTYPSDSQMNEKLYCVYR